MMPRAGARSPRVIEQARRASGNTGTLQEEVHVADSARKTPAVGRGPVAVGHKALGVIDRCVVEPQLNRERTEAEIPRRIVRDSHGVVVAVEAEGLSKQRFSMAELSGLPPNEGFEASQVAPDDIVEIVYTSGTTGDPMGVVHRHKNICANLTPIQLEMRKYEKWARPFQPVRILDMLPLSHLFGQSLGIFVPPLLPWKVLEGPLNIYKKACAEHGHQSDIVYIRPVYIDHDEKLIRKEVEPALLNFLAFNASPVESIQDEEKKAELRAKGYGFYASGALESLTKLTYDEIVDQEIGFIGTPEKVIKQIRALQEKGGIGELAIVSNFGGLEHWKSVKTQHMFAKHVMPAFRASQPEAKAAD